MYSRNMLRTSIACGRVSTLILELIIFRWAWRSLAVEKLPSEICFVRNSETAENCEKYPLLCGVALCSTGAAVGVESISAASTAGATVTAAVTAAVGSTAVVGVVTTAVDTVTKFVMAASIRARSA